ncbi:hypothetical protein [Blastococcus litoris]|uniref:hypothetical protein n=1 Tax=Blastococcus litoris TaxID=2171622 RepID=UPI000E3058CD|nr:hypothetical protein [Blastococcus litoris]
MTSTARHVGIPWRGPFRRLRHEHLFQPVGDGTTTRMTDRVSFDAPFGPVGAVVGRALLAP